MLVGAGLLVLGGVGAVVAALRSPPAAPTYLTRKVTRGDLTATVSASGVLRGKDTVSVGAEVSGRVRAVSADFNDRVTTGQLLVEIDPAMLRAQLAQNRAQLLSAKADVKNKRATAAEQRAAAERTKGLAKEGLASAQTLESAVASAERAEAQVEAAEAQVVVAEATVQSTQTSLGKTQIRAPMDGVVLSRDVEVGQTLTAAMSTPVVFKLARNLEDMEVTISIDEADVGHTHEGQRATFTVDAWPGKVFEGALVSIHNVSTTKDNVVTYDALLSVKNDERLLRPGMTATVTIHTDARHDVRMVPNPALRWRPAPTTGPRPAFAPPEDLGPKTSDTRPRVYVLRNGVPQEVTVTAGLTDGERTELKAGDLAVDDEVIVDAQEAQHP
jgi:HlyD family secretion protein